MNDDYYDGYETAKEHYLAQAERDAEAITSLLQEIASMGKTAKEIRDAWDAWRSVPLGTSIGNKESLERWEEFKKLMEKSHMGLGEL